MRRVLAAVLAVALGATIALIAGMGNTDAPHIRTVAVAVAPPSEADRGFVKSDPKGRG